MLPYLLFFIFATLPLYVLPSGFIQIVDAGIVLLTLFLIITLTRSEYLYSRKILIPFLPFIIWVVVVGLFYQTLDSIDYTYAINAMYFIYVFVVLIIAFVAFHRISRHKRKWWWILIILLIACATPWLAGSTQTGGRNNLSFNNPNQLGYFGVCIMVITVVLLRYGLFTNQTLGFWQMSLIIAIALICNAFVYLSASRAAIGSVLLANCYFAIYISQVIHARWRYVVWFVIFFISSFLIVMFTTGESSLDLSNVYSGSLSRLREKSLLDHSDLKGRALGFFELDNLLELIIGNGGKIGRDTIDLEVHNALFGILRNYGFIGAALFLLGVFFCIARLGIALKTWVLLLPLMIYNMAHYGLRFRPLWISIGIFLALMNHFEADKPTKGTPAIPK